MTKLLLTILLVANCLTLFSQDSSWREIIVDSNVRFSVNCDMQRTESEYNSLWSGGFSKRKFYMIARFHNRLVFTSAHELDSFYNSQTEHGIIEEMVIKN